MLCMAAAVSREVCMQMYCFERDINAVEAATQAVHRTP
jgi:hypothetical protein